MKNWKYAVWTVLLLELVVFGKNEKAYWISGSLIALFAIVHVLLDNKPRFQSAKSQIQKSNPIPRPIWFGVLIFIALVAAILPYLTGEIHPMLTFFTATAWAMLDD